MGSIENGGEIWDIYGKHKPLFNDDGPFIDFSGCYCTTTLVDYMDIKSYL